MTTCNDCKYRTGWRTAFVTTGPEKMVVADCMHPNWPEWWKARNERPIVSPGAGSACKKYERTEGRGLCLHKRYSVDVAEQTGRCNDCGAEGRMMFVVGDPVTAERDRCAQIVRDAARHGCACSDSDSLAKVILAANVADKLRAEGESA